MKNVIFAAVLAACAAAMGVVPATASPFEEHAFFQRLTGDWTGDGELRNADGNTHAIHEEWSGERRADGTFAMEGVRNWDEETQEFRWVFHFNESTELYEVEYWHTGMDDVLLMEASITDDQATVKAPVGDPQSELRITNRFDGNDTLRGEVLFADGEGREVLAGEVVHHRRDS